jgi:hypothetical protein
VCRAVVLVRRQVQDGAKREDTENKETYIKDYAALCIRTQYEKPLRESLPNGQSVANKTLMSSPISEESHVIVSAVSIESFVFKLYRDAKQREMQRMQDGECCFYMLD